MPHEWKVQSQRRWADDWICQNCGYMITYSVQPENDRLVTSSLSSESGAPRMVTCEEYQIFGVCND